MQSQVTKQRNAESTNGTPTASTTQSSNNGLAPELQSQLDREANYVEAADQIGTKMSTNPSNITKEEADLLHSREHRAFGATEKGGIASQAQSLAAENAGDKKTSSTVGGATNLTPEQQSQLDRETNFAQAADQVGSKMETNPGSVTKEDADLLHSREHRAHGLTEKGGIASQAQSLASENAGDKK